MKLYFKKMFSGLKENKNKRLQQRGVYQAQQLVSSLNDILTSSKNSVEVGSKTCQVLREAEKLNGLMDWKGKWTDRS